MNNRKFSEQEQVRRTKLEKLINNKKNPFNNSRFTRTHNSKKVIEEFQIFTKEELHETNHFVSLAGRIRMMRQAGKATFATIQDQEGTFQIYVRSDAIDDTNYQLFLDYDLGDIVGIEGTMMKTNTGELTIRVQKIVLLSKSLRPLPDKYHGIVDIEERYRRRYVDLIMNPETKDIFVKRSKILFLIRQYLDERNYLEVETPVLQSVHGGAAAKPFVTYHNTLERDFFLRVATELPLKRLIVGGFDKVYEIGRLFRNEGMDTRHNPEFTSIEIYVAYEDMNFMMELTENLICYVVKNILQTDSVIYGGQKISFNQPWKRWNMLDAILEITGVNFHKTMTFAAAKKIAFDHHINVEKFHNTVGHIINLFFEEFVEPKLVQPTFIYNYPSAVSPLSKSNVNNPNFTDRFELFINGREYANAYSELNDPIDQYQRFENQLLEREGGNEEAQELDIDFIEALEYGLPPTGGLGIGIDRLVMLITNQDSIKDVLLFPHMRPRGK